MTDFALPLAAAECDRLKNGQMVVKGILASPELAALAVGSNVTVPGCDFLVRIAAVRRYVNFRQLVLNEGLRNLMSSDATVADAVGAMQGKVADAEVEERGV